MSFAGNADTSRQTVESYMLYRAAQLTLNNGYDWFETVERHTQGQTEVVGPYDPWWGPYGPYWRPYWRAYGRGGWGAWGPGWGPGWDVNTITRFEASTEIVMHHGPKPADHPRGLDAHQVVTNLGPHIVLPGQKK